MDDFQSTLNAVVVGGLLLLFFHHRINSEKEKAAKALGYSFGWLLAVMIYLLWANLWTTTCSTPSAYGWKSPSPARRPRDR